jgi:hypothetical protein
MIPPSLNPFIIINLLEIPTKIVTLRIKQYKALALLRTLECNRCRKSFKFSKITVKSKDLKWEWKKMQVLLKEM